MAKGKISDPPVCIYKVIATNKRICSVSKASTFWKGKAQGDLTSVCKKLMGDGGKKKPGFSQWCPVTGWKAMGIN